MSLAPGNSEKRKTNWGDRHKGEVHRVRERRASPGQVGECADPVGKDQPGLSLVHTAPLSCLGQSRLRVSCPRS